MDKTPFRNSGIDHEGEITIESYTVMFGADGPAMAHAACLLPDGSRTWANNTDPGVMSAMTEEEFCGRRGRIDGRGNLTVL